MFIRQSYPPSVLRFTVASVVQDPYGAVILLNVDVAVSVTAAVAILSVLTAKSSILAFVILPLTIAALSMYAFSIYVPAGYVTPPIVRGEVYTENGATGVDVPAGFTISNASDVIVNTLRGTASFAVLIKPKPETYPLLSILTEYLPSIPLIDVAFVVIDVVLLPTVVESVVTSDDRAVTTPSMFDTSVCSVVTADAFAEILLSAAVRSD